VLQLNLVHIQLTAITGSKVGEITAFKQGSNTHTHTLLKLEMKVLAQVIILAL
jgi:hypothetical protein